MLHTTLYRTATVDFRDRWGVCVCVCVGEVRALATVASLYSSHKRPDAAMTHSALQ